MKRTQVQLEEGVWERLREKAFREHRSISDAIRQLIARDEYGRLQSSEKRIKEFSFVGSGSSNGSGSGKISQRHDKELEKAYQL